LCDDELNGDGELLKKLREIALAIAALTGVLAFGLIFYGMVRMSEPPCQQQADEAGIIENLWCAEKPKWMLPSE
jgi:hypothetical protein